MDIWGIFSFIISSAVGSLKINFICFMYVWLCWVLVSGWGLTLVLALQFIAVHRPLILVASLLWNTGSQRVGSVAVARATALVAPRMWDLSGPGIEPVSSVLAIGFLTTGPWGRSLCCWFFKCGPQTSSGSITWEPIRTVNSQAPPQTSWTRNFGSRAGNLYLTSPPGDSDHPSVWESAVVFIWTQNCWVSFV